MANRDRDWRDDDRDDNRDRDFGGRNDQDRDRRRYGYGDHPSGGYVGPYRDARFERGGFDEGRERFRGYDARTGDRMGWGDGRVGQFGPGGMAPRDAQYYELRRRYEQQLDRDYEEFRHSRQQGEMKAHGGRGGPSASGLDVFDNTLQTAHIWLNEIVDEIGPDRQVAWHALTAVLRTIRDRVPIDLAAHLGAQLPMIVRGAYYDQFRPSADIERTRSLDEFLASVGEHLRGIGRPVGSRDAARAVFRVLSRHVSDGQIRKIIDAMPEQVRESWLGACQDIQSPEARAAGERGQDW